MKWIGQHIWDLVSRFRSHVYFEGVQLGIIESDGVLGVNADGKVVKSVPPSAQLIKTAVSTTNANHAVTFVADTDGAAGDSLLVNNTFLYNPSIKSFSVKAGDIMSQTNISPGHTQLWNTDNDANPATLKFYKKRKDGVGVNDNVAAVDGDQVGSITWYGTDAQTSPQWWREYATIIGSIEEGDQGDECGKLTLKVGNNNTPTDGLVLTGNKTTAGQVDVAIGSSPTSQTTINGDLTVQNTADDNARPVLKLFNNRASNNTNGGATGEIHFSGKDANNLAVSGEVMYGMIECTAIDVTASTEDSRITFYNRFNGTLVNKLILAEFGGVNSVTGDTRLFGYGHFNDYIRITETASGSQQPRLMLDYSDNIVVAHDPLGKIEWYNPDCGENTIEIRGVADDGHSTVNNLNHGDSRIEFWTRESIGANDYNYNGSSETAELTKAMTISHDNIVTLEHELVVKGNKIRDNDNVACVTFDSSGNTTIAGTLNASLTGNVTGNAATATALQNARTIGGVSFDGTADIDLPGVNTAGSQDTTGNAATATAAKNVTGQASTDVNISSNKDVIVTIDSDNNTTNSFKVKNSSTELFSINEIGAVNFSGTVITNVNTGAGQLDIQTDGNINFTVDRSNNSNNNYFSFINYNQEVARIDDSGNLRLEGTGLSNGTNASNFRISSSRILDIQHAGAYDINLGNATNSDVLKVQGDSEVVTVNGALTVSGDITANGNIVGDGNTNLTGVKTITAGGNITGKQYQVFPSSFVDDIGTSEVFIPIHGTTFEQSTVYQDDTALLAPCDGRVVSVTLSMMSVTGTADVNVRVYSLPPNTSGTASPFTNSWVLEETEEVNITSSDDSHVVHFGFSNNKHFESTEKFAISIQADSDITGNTYIYATTVIEWDYNTLLGASSTYESAP